MVLALVQTLTIFCLHDFNDFLTFTLNRALFLVFLPEGHLPKMQI